VSSTGICNDSIPVRFVNELQALKYATVEEDVTLSVKYFGIDINSFWKVNYVSNDDIISHYYLDKFCHTTENVTLPNVQLQDTANYTVTARRLGLKEREVSSTVELSKSLFIVVVCVFGNWTFVISIQ